MKAVSKHIIKLVLLVLVVAAVTWLFSYLEPENIINTFGERNLYLAVFAIAVFGGVSAFSAAGFYAAVFALAAGGANPLLMAAVAAPGVLIGDWVFWYLGLSGKRALEAQYGALFEKFTSWLRQKPKWLSPLIIYVYTGLTPLPGDLLMVSLAVLGYRFKQIFLPTLLGNFTLVLLISLFAKYSLPF